MELGVFADTSKLLHFFPLSSLSLNIVLQFVGICQLSHSAALPRLHVSLPSFVHMPQSRMYLYHSRCVAGLCIFCTKCIVSRKFCLNGDLLSACRRVNLIVLLSRLIHFSLRFRGV